MEDSTRHDASQKTRRQQDGDDHSASYQSEVREMEQRKAGGGNEATNEQYSGDAAGSAASNLEAEKTQARVEGLIGNPD